MNRSQPTPHFCSPQCFYRYQTDGMCTLGKKDVPHPRDNHPCLYPSAMQERYSNIDYREIATHKWNPNPEPPAKVQKLLKIVGETLNLG